MDQLVGYHKKKLKGNNVMDLSDLTVRMSHIFSQVSCVSGKGELLLSSKDQTPLTEDVFEKVVHLFASSNVSLRKDGDTVMTEINPEAGHAPLLLCIAVRALASLSVC